ncbi:MAG TPA: ABC transporter substrate-binding protein [Mycobacteriales bacterium]|nr:ABC transporter substrate-binding protein [Mycobacteriales bacterium]
MNRVASGLAALAAATVALAGCGSSSSGGGATATPTGTASSASLIAGCSPSTLQTVSAGNITIGVDQPVYPPWFNDNNSPIDGNGFESAVDLAIAKELGYGPSQIKVKRITFTQAIGPAARDFDYDLDEFTINAGREKAVDFSTPYYDVAEAVVAMQGTKAAAVTTLAGLKSLKLGAQSGSTDQQTISDVIKPSSSAFFGSNALAVQALKNGQIDGLVVDLPTAFYITSAQVKGSVIVGQLPTGSNPEQFGALLAKDSPLTSCVSKAVQALKASGQLAAIQNKWLAQEGNAPVLQ